MLDGHRHRSSQTVSRGGRRCLLWSVQVAPGRYRSPMAERGERRTRHWLADRSSQPEHEDLRVCLQFSLEVSCAFRPLIPFESDLQPQTRSTGSSELGLYHLPLPRADHGYLGWSQALHPGRMGGQLWILRGIVGTVVLGPLCKGTSRDKMDRVGWRQ